MSPNRAETNSAKGLVGAVLASPREGAPHHLTVKTTLGDRQRWFTAEEIAGYLGG